MNGGSKAFALASWSNGFWNGHLDIWHRQVFNLLILVVVVPMIYLLLQAQPVVIVSCNL
jgi:hypothetical protein